MILSGCRMVASESHPSYMQSHLSMTNVGSGGRVSGQPVQCHKGSGQLPLLKLPMHKDGWFRLRQQSNFGCVISRYVCECGHITAPHCDVTEPCITKSKPARFLITRDVYLFLPPNISHITHLQQVSSYHLMGVAIAKSHIFRFCCIALALFLM